MGENSRIEWCDHTFNPWTGCTRVSPGCDHCYAAALAKRSPQTFGSWEPGAPRKRTGEAYWRQPLAWNRKAAREGRRARVFCASMADVFDNQAPEEWRWYLWRLIARTPHLDWLLLTKRPQNIEGMLPPETLARFEDEEEGPWHAPWPWPNVWLGTTVENQAEADRRIPHLLAVPARVRFLSCEPLLGPVNLARFTFPQEVDATLQSLRWVIAGGESGPGARPMHPDWVRRLRDQCASAGVPFFFKQWGEWRPISEGPGDWYDSLYRSNRVAERGECQAALDECFGRRCTVLKSVVHHDGTATGILDAGAWQAGSGAMLTFRVGKRAAGALLDGREHREIPHG